MFEIRRSWIHSQFLGTFRLHADENLPGVLYGDDLRVKQVFSNILSNAFKYTNSGTVDWRISFEYDGNDILLISSIADTGIGMKPESVAKLFSEYNQVDAASNRAVEGTGLGLAIARRMVEMMDGAITVRSEYGVGTTFFVRIRQGCVSDTPIGRTVAENLANFRYHLPRLDKNTKIKRADLSFAHILVVDDIPTNLDVVKGMMKPYGVKIDCALSGRQAIMMIRSEKPRYNAVFMDHMMPEMDGIETTRHIREEIGTEYARNIPIIALTANAIVGNEEMFLNNGFQDFISKPIDMAKLDAVLRRWVVDTAAQKSVLRGIAGDALSADTKFSGTPDGIMNIPGLDSRRALERFADDDEVLIDVLSSYAKNTRPLLSALHEYLEAGNLSDYAITVHGVKGSSYGVCADEVGRAAEELETAAKAGELGAVESGHPAFAATAETLLDNIERALGSAAVSGL